MQPTRIVLMRVPRKERAKFMIWQVLTESCLHKGHGWFLPRKVHESARYDVSRRRHFQMKEKINKHMILTVKKCHLDPAKPGPWATLSHSTVFDNWCFLENCNPNIQWLKIFVFSTQICHNVSQLGASSNLRQTMTGFRWLNQELQLLLRHNCDGLRELVLHVHRCPKLAKAAKHLGQLCPPCSFPHQRVNANTAH